MENPFTSVHLAHRTTMPLPRVFGLFHHTVHTVKAPQRWSSINFSFILRGTGWYRVDYALHAVRALSVFRQYPGPVLSYGPHRSWRECSIIYLNEEEAALRQAGILPWEEAVLTVPDAQVENVTGMWRQLLALRPQARDIGSSIDALALGLLLLLRDSQRAVPKTRDIEDVREQLHLLDRTVPRIADLAASCSCTEASFRRRWQQAYGCSPVEYAFRLKTQRACELLTCTDMSIGCVAQAVGFPDQLYFSKWFRKRSGCSPTVYRQRHHLGPLATTQPRAADSDAR